MYIIPLLTDIVRRKHSIFIAGFIILITFTVRCKGVLLSDSGHP